MSTTSPVPRICTHALKELVKFLYRIHKFIVCQNFVSFFLRRKIAVFVFLQTKAQLLANKFRFSGLNFMVKSGEIPTFLSRVWVYFHIYFLDDSETGNKRFVFPPDYRIHKENFFWSKLPRPTSLNIFQFFLYVYQVQASVQQIEQKFFLELDLVVAPKFPRSTFSDFYDFNQSISLAE